MGISGIVGSVRGMGMSRKWIKFQYYFAMVWLIRRIPVKRLRWRASDWLFRGVKVVPVDCIGHLVIGEEVRDRSGDVIGFWHSGYWDPSLPYQGEDQ